MTTRTGCLINGHAVRPRRKRQDRTGRPFSLHSSLSIFRTGIHRLSTIVVEKQEREGNCRFLPFQKCRIVARKGGGLSCRRMLIVPGGSGAPPGSSELRLYFRFVFLLKTATPMRPDTSRINVPGSGTGAGTEAFTDPESGRKTFAPGGVSCRPGNELYLLKNPGCPFFFDETALGGQV